MQLNKNLLVSMFVLSALFHDMVRRNWPSSGVQGVFMEAAVPSI
jgi:hypothetical protein